LDCFKDSTPTLRISQLFGLLSSSLSPESMLRKLKKNEYWKIWWAFS
jgi:hypothetical protein